MNKVAKVLSLVAVAALAGSVFAQGGGGGGQGRGGQGRGGFGGGGVSEIQLLRRVDVQTELKVTDDQKTKIAALRGGGGGPGGGGRGPGGGGGGGFMAMQGQGQGGGQQMTPEQRAEAQAKQIAEILNPGQAKRLHEIWIQVGGNGILTNPMLQKELGFTDAQKEKVATLQAQQREAMQNAGAPPNADAIAKMRETMNTELGKVLTSDQATKLNGMKGAPFKLDPAVPLNQFGGGGNRGGGGGGGNGGGNNRGGGF